MSLNEKSKIINWPETHYVFIEKKGPFQDTAPKAWQNLHEMVPAVLENNKITGYMSLYKVEPEMIYRAGLALAEKPVKLPAGLKYDQFKGGKYTCFTLTGPYEQLPEACGRVFEIVEEKEIQTRDDAFNIENYLNDPRSTPAEKLVTEILIPTL